MSLLDEASRSALASAVKAIESRSRVEVVVVARARSSSYLQVDLLLGIASGYATLAFMLLSPWPFDIPWILLDPLLVGIATAFLFARFSTLQRILVSKGLRQQAVRNAAFATFVEKGIGLTRKRTGLLVYLSQLERVAVLVADDGIRRAVDAASWAGAVSRIESAYAGGETGTFVAAEIQKLGDLLEAVLPRRPEDTNEISDDVVES